MNFDIRAFCFALCISFGLMLVFMGNTLLVGAIFGNELILKEIIAGLIIVFIGLSPVFFTINSSSTRKVKE